MIAVAITRAWYARRGWTRWLAPLAWLYGVAVALRRGAYRRGWLAATHPGVPVLVVGNLTVGGTGKTPLVAALVQRLAQRGLRPGIVARGYASSSRNEPLAVSDDSNPSLVGDEPLLLVRCTGAPVVVCRRRVAAARRLVEAEGVNVIVADDGLQHYALARDAEIAVRDRMRGYGNGRLLPAGPLREPLGRLAEVDLDLVQGQGGDFWLEPGAARNLADCHREQPLAAFIGQGVHAVAGIGNPEGFFATLRSAGLSPLPHIFPDHHRFRRADIDFRDDHPVLMTEKDAVKCHGLADQRHWAVPVTACFSALAAARVDTLLDRLAEMVT